MLLIMKEELTQEGDAKLPKLWCRKEDGCVRYGVALLHLPNTLGYPGTEAYDLETDKVIAEFKQLQSLGVRGEIHLADSEGPRYIHISFMDDGVFFQTGEITWPGKLEKM